MRRHVSRRSALAAARWIRFEQDAPSHSYRSFGEFRIGYTGCFEVFGGAFPTAFGVEEEDDLCSNMGNEVVSYRTIAFKHIDRPFFIFQLDRISLAGGFLVFTYIISVQCIVLIP